MPVSSVHRSDFEGNFPLLKQYSIRACERIGRIVNTGRLGRYAVELEDGKTVAGLERLEVIGSNVESTKIKNPQSER